MALPVPLALDNTGVKVLPTAELKALTCIECAMLMVLVEGDSSQCCHFAHESSDACDCPAGDSLKTLATQLIVAKHITTIKFMNK